MFKSQFDLLTGWREPAHKMQKWVNFRFLISDSIILSLDDYIFKSASGADAIEAKAERTQD